MVNTLLPPVNKVAETFRIVSLLAKLHVKGLVCGSDILHFTGPSSTVPLPAAAKVNILSFWQACKKADTSEPPTVAALNFHVAVAIRSVFVLGAGLFSFLQEANTSSTVKRPVSKVVI